MDNEHGDRDRPDRESEEAGSVSQPEGLPALRAFLVDRYGDLKRRLTRRLGSADWAEDALQDTYLRLDRMEAVGEIRDPGAYLLRAAFNVAMNRKRVEHRQLSAKEIDALLHIADDAPDALRIIEGRSDLMRLGQAMGELPERRRAILLAARLEGLTHRQIGHRFGISVSMVEKEIRQAQEYCVARFRRKRL